MQNVPIIAPYQSLDPDIEIACCPQCKSQVIVKVHRTLWEKLTHWDQEKWMCRGCRTLFYRK